LGIRKKVKREFNFPFKVLFTRLVAKPGENGNKNKKSSA
jgi:hypothetical protein